MTILIKIPQGEIEAKSYLELVKRIEQENNFWDGVGVFELNDLSIHPNQRPPFEALVHLINSMLSYWENALEELKGFDGRSFLSDDFETFRDEIENATDVPPKSTSFFGTTVNQLCREGRRGDAFALLVGSQNELSGIANLLGVNDARLLSNSYLGYAQGFSAAIQTVGLAKFAEKTNKELENEVAVAQKMVAALGDDISKVEDLKESIEQRSDAAEERIIKKYEDMRRKALFSMRKLLKANRESEGNRQNDFGSLLKTFNAHLRLKRPVELWSDRRGEHETNSKKSWRIFVGAGMMFIAAAITIAVCFGDEIAATFVRSDCLTGAEDSCNRISPKGPLTISMMLAVSTVWLWFLRLQMKIYLSERHLALDARERSAFAETYLSLLKGEHVTTEHEAVILQSLFRPTQDGIIKDDVGPDMSIAGLLAKSLDKK